MDCIARLGNGRAIGRARVNVFVIRAFVKMRETLRAAPELARKLAALEEKLTARLDVHEAAIVQVLQEVIQILNPPPTPTSPRPQIGSPDLFFPSLRLSTVNFLSRRSHVRRRINSHPYFKLQTSNLKPLTSNIPFLN